MNQWPGRVSNRTITLFQRWLEWASGEGLRSTYVVSPETRYKAIRSRNPFGEIKVAYSILEGFVNVNKPLKKEIWSDVHEFSVVFHEKLPFLDQIVILANEDPLNRFKDNDGHIHNRELWKNFLKEIKVYNQSNFIKSVERAWTLLQQLLQERGMVEIMTGEHELHGWDQICEYLKVSKATAIKWAKDPDMRMPITLIGKSPYTTKEKLDKWKEDRLKDNPYYEKGD